MLYWESFTFEKELKFGSLFQTLFLSESGIPIVAKFTSYEQYLAEYKFRVQRTINIIFIQVFMDSISCFLMQT